MEQWEHPFGTFSSFPAVNIASHSTVSVCLFVNERNHRRPVAVVLSTCFNATYRVGQLVDREWFKSSRSFRGQASGNVI